VKEKLVLILLLFASGCGIYSFSGVNLEGAKTISFKYFDNSASIVNPDLTRVIYDEMYKKFVNQTNLEYLQRDGDIYFEGKVIDYSVKPIDIKSGETAAYNRLTITVKVTYKNFKNPKNNFEKSFSWYSDYSSDKLFADVEATLVDEITKKIVDDIFQASVVNW
jgi:hypothetical protein